MPGDHRAAGDLRRPASTGSGDGRPGGFAGGRRVPVWDEIAVAAHVWTLRPRTTCTGLSIPFRVPIEEVLFFLVIPLCALLTYNAVSTILRNRCTRR